MQKAQNKYLDYLIDSTFQGLNRFFVLSLKCKTKRVEIKVETKDYNVMIAGINFFDLLVNNNLRTYDNIRNIEMGQGDGYTTGYLLDYPYLKEYQKLIPIDLNKKQKLDADPKAIQQINFTENLNRTEEAKETVLNFSKRTVKLLWFYFVLI